MNVTGIDTLGRSGFTLKELNEKKAKVACNVSFYLLPHIASSSIGTLTNTWYKNPNLKVLRKIYLSTVKLNNSLQGLAFVER